MPRRSRVPLYTGVRVGTAGWSLPKDARRRFPENGSHLERYAHRLAAVEINATFYKVPRVSTYERWAASVPQSFRFSVKLPRAITHEARLEDSAGLLRNFLDGLRPLGDRLGPLLVQLPPSVVFDRRVAGSFFRNVRRRFDGPVACEPRHSSWLDPEAEKLLAEQRVARVAADPPRLPEGAEPGGWDGLVYYRLHGSPRRFHSSYPPACIEQTARELRSAAADGTETWCIFDNTASGAGTKNALSLLTRLRPRRRK